MPVLTSINMWPIIGIDCATQPEKVGLALAHIDKGDLIIDEIALGSKRREPAMIISEWMKKSDQVLLAFDAPLGWPEAMGRSLADHQAGQVVSSSANKLFRRCTDDEIYKRLGKRPLEVGANLIARTAEAALRLLGELRNTTGCEIPLAWDISELHGICAIEVYPAAIISVMGVKSASEFFESLPSEIRLPDSPLLKTSDHVRDAVLCAITGADFLKGNCVGPTPEQRKLALKEGWIWCRSM